MLPHRTPNRPASSRAVGIRLGSKVPSRIPARSASATRAHRGDARTPRTWTGLPSGRGSSLTVPPAATARTRGIPQRLPPHRASCPARDQAAAATQPPPSAAPADPPEDSCGPPARPPAAPTAASRPLARGAAAGHPDRRLRRLRSRGYPLVLGAIPADAIGRDEDREEVSIQVRGAAPGPAQAEQGHLPLQVH